MHATTQPEGTLQITMSQEEVATLVDLCFAGAASDMVPRRKDTQLRINRFLVEIQDTLFDRAQSYWSSRQKPQEQVA